MKIVSGEKAKIIDNLNKRMIIDNQRVLNARQGISEVCQEISSFIRGNSNSLSSQQVYDLLNMIDNLVDKVDRPLKYVNRSINNLNNNL